MYTEAWQEGHVYEHRGETAPAGSWLKIGDDLEVPAVALRVERNAEIYGEGESTEFVYQVVRGAVRTARYLEDGRRQVGGFYLPGDVFGLETGGLHRFSAEAIVDTELRLAKRSIVDKAANADVQAARDLWSLASAHLAQLEDQLLLLGRKTAVERVGAFLMEMSRRTLDVGAVDLPMTRNDIADYLGLTIETVSRTLTQLERSKVISLPSSRHIVLRDQAALLGA